MRAMQFSAIHGQTALARIPRTLAGLGCIVATTAMPAITRATPQPLVASTSLCPEAAEVEQEILGLTPTLYRGVISNQVHIQISDTGAEYTAAIFDPELRAIKSFFDPARDCQRRARFVAVFVVLTLMPPGIEKELTIPDSPSQFTSAPEKRPSNSADTASGRYRVLENFYDRQVVATIMPRTASAVRIEAAATLQRTPAVFESLAMTGIGGEIRGLFGRGHLAALVSIGYIKRSTFGVDGIEGSMRRAPAVVGLQWRLRLRTLELAPEAGAIAMFERVRGNGFLHSEQNSTMQFGGRLGGTVSGAYGRLWPYFGIYFNAFPAPQDLVTAPQGAVGTTPAIELGTTLGVSYAL